MPRVFFDLISVRFLRAFIEYIIRYYSLTMMPAKFIIGEA